MPKSKSTIIVPKPPFLPLLSEILLTNSSHHLLKCCTKYASKFGKLSSGHRTGKGQFSFQPQRRAMPKNIQTTIQVHLFHMLVRLWTTSFKLGFSNTWTENFQMYQLDLEMEEETEIKYFANIHWIIEKAREFQKNIYFCFIDYAKVWLCGSQQNVGNS